MESCSSSEDDSGSSGSAGSCPRTSCQATQTVEADFGSTPEELVRRSLVPGLFKPARSRDTPLGRILASASGDTAEELYGILFGTESPLSAEKLSSDALLTVGLGMSRTPNAAEPKVVAAVLAMALPKIIPGFAELSMEKRAAFVACLVPSEKNMQKITDTTELFQMMGITHSLAERVVGGEYVTYLCVQHDEGNDKNSNSLLLYGAWRDMEGNLVKPHVLGNLRTDKTGEANARAIRQQLVELGLNGDQIKMIVETVDGAGTKVARWLRDEGLVFDVVCELHNINKMAEQWEAAFGKGDFKDANTVNLCYQVPHIVRELVGIKTFFVLAANALRRKMTEAGASPALVRQVVDAKEIQRRAKVPDKANRVRWISLEKVAALLASETALVDFDGRMEQYLEPKDVTFRAIVILGLAETYRVYNHKWFSRVSKDKDKYGEDILVVKVAALLEDVYMIAQLDVLAEVHSTVLLPLLAAAASFENEGGGAAQQLKIQTLRLQMVTSIDVDAMKSVVRAKTNLDAAQFDNCKVGVLLYLKKMEDKTREHLRRTRANNLPLALADEFMAPAVADLICKMAFDDGLLLGEVGPVAEQVGVLPWSVGSASTGGIYTLEMTARQIAADCEIEVRAELGDHGVGLKLDKFRWWEDVLKPVLPEFLKWRKLGCPQNPNYMDGFVNLLRNALQVARLTTMCVEVGVNHLKESSSGPGHTTPSGRQTQQTVYDAHLKIKAAAKEETGRIRENNGDGDGGEQKDENGGEGEPNAKKAKIGMRGQATYMREPKTKSFLFMWLRQISLYAAAGEAHFVEARKAAGQRADTAVRTTKEDAAILTNVRENDEANAAAVQKAGADFVSKLAAAKEKLVDIMVQPEAFQLVPLTVKYTIKMMIETLVERKVRRNPALNVTAVKAELAKMSAGGDNGLRNEMRVDFFGEEWRCAFAPKNMPQAHQDKAVAKAKEMATKEMVKAGTAWAWKVVDEVEVEGEGGEGKAE